MPTCCSRFIVLGHKDEGNSGQEESQAEIEIVDASVLLTVCSSWRGRSTYTVSFLYGLEYMRDCSRMAMLSQKYKSSNNQLLIVLYL